MAARGCGDSREEDGLYLVAEVSEFGTPWWKFLVDPPQPLSSLGLTVGQQGVTMIPRYPDQGPMVYDAWDWIGAGSGPYSKGYWNVPDFIEEGLRLGFSGRVPANKDTLAKLSHGSLHPLVHPRACIKNVAEAWENRHWLHCKTHQHAHDGIDPLERVWPDYICISMLWEFLEGTQPVTGDTDLVIRRMPPYCNQDPNKRPTFAYTGYGRPEALTLKYEPGLFMLLPINRLELVAGERTEEIGNMVAESGTDLELKVVDE
jgi:hypothetical protein